MTAPLSFEQECRAAIPGYDHFMQRTKKRDPKGRPFWKVPKSFVFSKLEPNNWELLEKHTKALLPVMKIFSNADMCDAGITTLSRYSGLSKAQISVAIKYCREENLLECRLMPPRGGRRYGHKKKVMLGIFQDISPKAKGFAIFRREIIISGLWSSMSSSEKSLYFVLLQGLNHQALSSLGNTPFSSDNAGMALPITCRKDDGTIAWDKFMQHEWHPTERSKLAATLPLVKFRKCKDGILTRLCLQSLSRTHPDSIETSLRKLENKHLLMVLNRFTVERIPAYHIFVPPQGEWMFRLPGAWSEKSDTLTPENQRVTAE